MQTVTSPEDLRRASGRAALAAARVAVLASLLVLTVAPRAWAHVDPSTCNHAGPSMEFLTFRSDGVTPIEPGQTVSPCETIVYQVKLTKQNDPTVCAFEGGKIFITTPDGVQYDVTPAGGVPCVGGTTSPCDPAVTEVFSQTLSFTISQPSGQAGATASYGLPCKGLCGASSFCGTGHNSPADFANVLSAGGATAVTVAPCPSSTPCVTSLCDPSATDQVGVRMGLCVTRNVTDSTPCAADNAGNPVTAIPGSCKTPGCEAGDCVQAHINVTDSTPCTDTDNNACTMAGCEAGSCVQTHVVKQRLGCRGRR